MASRSTVEKEVKVENAAGMEGPVGVAAVGARSPAPAAESSVVQVEVGGAAVRCRAPVVGSSVAAAAVAVGRAEVEVAEARFPARQVDSLEAAVTETTAAEGETGAKWGRQRKTSLPDRMKSTLMGRM